MDAEYIKKKRKELGLTQEDLARKTGVSRRTIANYEDGTAIPLSAQKLLSVVLGEKDAGDGYPILIDNMNIMYIPIVSAYEHQNYVRKFNEKEYVNNLPGIPIAHSARRDQFFVAFEVGNEAMEDGTELSILSSDIVAGLLMPKTSISGFKKSATYIIIHKEIGVLVRTIISVSENSIVLSARNELYGQTEVSMDDVLQLFSAKEIIRKA